MAQAITRASILVVEDDHDIRVSLRESLEAEGYFVASATNGAAALQLLDQISLPDLILLDVNMPLMNGAEFLKVLRKLPRFASIPVIQMTGANNPQLESVRCLVRKPFETDALLKTIEECLSS